MSTASKKQKVAAKRTSGFHVFKTFYPSGTGCYAGQDLDDDFIDANTSVYVVGEYDTKNEAVLAAKTERAWLCVSL